MRNPLGSEYSLGCGGPFGRGALAAGAVDGAEDGAADGVDDGAAAGAEADPAEDAPGDAAGDTEPVGETTGLDETGG